MDRRAKLLFKCAVTGLLFWLVAEKVDMSGMADLFRRAQPAWLALSFALVLLMTVLDALAFSTVMGILGHRVRLAPSFLYSLVSWFFSNLAPSTLGGDIFRTVQMQRLGAPLGTALRSVLLARMMSFAALMPVILLGLPIALTLVGNEVERIMLVTIAGIGTATLLAAYGGALLTPRLAGLLPPSLAGRAGALASDFRRANHSGLNTLSWWTLAAAQHVVRVAILAALAASLQLDIPFTTLFALAPAALLVAMIPVSLGSWGLREAAFVVFLGGAHIAPEAALSLSVAFGLLRVAMGGFGGLVWLAADRAQFGFELHVDTEASSEHFGSGKQAVPGQSDDKKAQRDEADRSGNADLPGC